MSFITTTTVLAAAVAQNATFQVAYPAGRTGGDFQGGVGHQLMASGRLYNCPVDFTVAFGEFVATITWKGANPLTAGISVRVQFDMGGEALEGIVTRAERAYPMRLDLGIPAATSAAALRAAAAVGAAGSLANLLPAGKTFDVPRNVIITSVGNDVGITFLVTGKDEYGVAMSELITGANAGVAAGKKAFKTITDIVASGAAAGNVSVGYGNVLGLPIFVPAVGLIIAELQDGGAAAAGTKVAGLSPLVASTNISADVRGTYVPNAAPDGAKAYSLFALVSYRTYTGVPQA